MQQAENHQFFFSVNLTVSEHHARIQDYILMQIVFQFLKGKLCTEILLGTSEIFYVNISGHYELYCIRFKGVKIFTFLEWKPYSTGEDSPMSAKKPISDENIMGVNPVISEPANLIPQKRKILPPCIFILFRGKCASIIFQQRQNHQEIKGQGTFLIEINHDSWFSDFQRIYFC